MTAIRVDLGSQAFNTQVADANGSLYYVTEIDGWDSPAQRQSFQGPASRHGSVILESLLDQRAVTLKGIVKATSETAFWISYNYMLGLVNNLYAPILLKMLENPTTKRLSVIRGGAVRQTFVGVGSFEFEIPLIAIDPLKYNDTATTTALAAAGTVALTNTGTFGTYPVVTLTAAGTVVLNNTTYAQTLTTGTDSLPSGTVVDFSARTVLSGSSNLYTTLDAGSVFWALQPGSNTITNTGTAPVSVTYRDAWI